MLGGYGAVGAKVVAELRAGGDDCLVAGRDPARVDWVLDLYEPGAATYRTALARVDVVVNAAGVEDPALAPRLDAQTEGVEARLIAMIRR